MASIAIVYSRALFNVAKEAKVVDSVAKDLKEFVNLCRISVNLRRTLFSSVFDPNTRVRISEEVAGRLGAQQITIKFLNLLSRKNRMAHLAEMTQEFDNLRDREKGIVKGTMTTAVAISREEIEGIARAIGKRVGKQVELSHEENEDLLGGFVVRVDGKTFDSSLRTQLKNLQEICNA